MKNENLKKFLINKKKNLNQIEKSSIDLILNSISLCPIELNLEDSLDLIGVNEFITILLNDFFLNSIELKIPKSKSQQKILQVLFESNSYSLTKLEILNKCEFNEPKINKFRPKKIFYNKWKNMKKLIENKFINKKGNPSIYQLTDNGIKICELLFEKIEFQSEKSNNEIIILILKKDLLYRTSIDVLNILKISNLSFKEVELPYGTICFEKNNQIYDFLIQFSTLSHVTEYSIHPQLNSSLFNKKIIILSIKENKNLEEIKLKYLFDYSIMIEFLQTPQLISNYLKEIVNLLNLNGKFLGNFDYVFNLNPNLIRTIKLEEIWKSQLKLIPGCGPQMSITIFSIFPTPKSLSDFFNSNYDSYNIFSNLINKKCGRRPSYNTIETLYKYFK